MISPLQKPLFQQYYETADERFHLLPPGIARDRQAPANAGEIRAEFRREFGLTANDLLLLQIGSGFRTKGLDRSLQALAALPPALACRCRLIAIGDDDATLFQAQARSLGIAGRVSILRGRSDILRFLLGCRSADSSGVQREHRYGPPRSAGRRLAGAHQAVCGYAHYIEEAGGRAGAPGTLLARRVSMPALRQMLNDEEAPPGLAAATALPMPSTRTSTATPTVRPTVILAAGP
jgi:UDP-glucose:(heptosyl)LPS alpha-1,3-glucosyltransferase